MKVNNIKNLSDNFIWGDGVVLITKYLGAAAGSEKIYVNIDYVPSKAYSAKYHSHSQQEEFFLILSGKGILHLNGAEYPVIQGDFIAKLPAQNIAHRFYNPNDESLIILDVGTNEKEDTCYYPEEDVYLHKSNGQHRIFKGTDLDQSWSSEPNV